MNVYTKLNKARIMLQQAPLKKSGNNKFAGYTYFELGDFLPTVQKIFNEVGLCGVVSYTAELASLTITDTEPGGASVTITSPLGTAALKGCHEVQNIGACETYQRRYLWVTAMEIVEHDALDMTTGRDDDKPKGKAPAKVETITADQAAEIEAFATSLGADIPAMKAYFGFETFETIPAAKYDKVMASLRKKQEQGA